MAHWFFATLVVLVATTGLLKAWLLVTDPFPDLHTGYPTWVLWLAVLVETSLIVLALFPQVPFQVKMLAFSVFFACVTGVAAWRTTPARSFALTLGICALVIGTFGTGIALANNPTPGVCSHGYCSTGCGGVPVGGNCAAGQLCVGPAGSDCAVPCDRGCQVTGIATCECQGTITR